MAGGLEFRNGRRARKESQSLELSLAGPAPGCVRPRTHTANELLTKPPASRTVALRGFPPCSLSPQGVSRQPATPRALLVVRDDESDVREPLQKKIRAGCAGPQIFVASGGLHIIGGMAYSLLALREKREHGLRTILGVCCVAALVGCAQSSVAPTFPSSVTQTQSSRGRSNSGSDSRFVDHSSAFETLIVENSACGHHHPRKPDDERPFQRFAGRRHSAHCEELHGPDRALAARAAD